MTPAQYSELIREREIKDFAEMKHIIRWHGPDYARKILEEAWQEILDEPEGESSQEDENKLNDPRRGQADELNRGRT